MRPILPQGRKVEGKINAAMSRIVELHPHNPEWAVRYQAEAAILMPILGEQLVLIEHVGSTAIPRIKAKPIIDYPDCSAGY